MKKLKVVIAGCHLVQSLLSSLHAQNVSKHTKTCVTLVSHIERMTLTEGTRKQGAEENISFVREEVTDHCRKPHN
jgi:hypothetical protein